MIPLDSLDPMSPTARAMVLADAANRAGALQQLHVAAQAQAIARRDLAERQRQAQDIRDAVAAAENIARNEAIRQAALAAIAERKMLEELEADPEKAAAFQAFLDAEDKKAARAAKRRSS